MNRRALRQAPPSSAQRASLPDPSGPAALPIQAGLESYAEPLSRRLAIHLLRRVSFGAHLREIEDLTGLSVEVAVNRLVNEALAQPMPEPPAWIDQPLPLDEQAREPYFTTNQLWMLEYQAAWLKQMFYGGLRERMTLFWHNHFVTHTDKYRLAPFAYRYLTTLRTHALGNFKDFVRAIGLDPAMLLYLNSAQNRVGEPNENYARELLELFTMGQFDGKGNENYTQLDIQEIARALTGWYANPFTLNVLLLSEGFDSGEKTFFGRTGSWGYDDVIDILFDERAAQIAAFVCRKLYKAFVYAVPDEDLVAALAQIFLDNDFEIAPVLRELFRSAHFLDDQIIGAQIKSPVPMLVGLQRELEPNLEPDGNFFIELYYATRKLGQHLLNPPNVAGWPGQRIWLNTTTLQDRWHFIGGLIAQPRNFHISLAETVLHSLPEPIHPSDERSIFVLPLALAEHLLSVPPELLDLIVPEEDFGGDLINNPIPHEVRNGPAHMLNLAKIFLANRPWYEWSLYSPLATPLLRQYLSYLARLPEFQLT